MNKKEKNYDSLTANVLTNNLIQMAESVVQKLYEMNKIAEQLKIKEDKKRKFEKANREKEFFEQKRIYEEQEKMLLEDRIKDYKFLCNIPD